MTLFSISEKRKFQKYQLAIAKITEYLYDINSPDEAINKALNTLATTSLADRCYIFEHLYDENDIPYCNQLFEYVNERASKQIDNPLLTHFYYQPNGMQWVYEDLKKGKAINKTLKDAKTDNERHVFEVQEIQSMLLVPIILNKKFWGFIGFDDCFKKRKWNAEDKLLLSSAGTIIANTLYRVKFQDELKLSHNFYKGILESSFDGITVLGANKEIIYQSTANPKVLGYSNQEFRKLNIFSLFHPDDLPIAEKTFAYIVGHPREAVTVELKYLHKSGEYIYVEMRVINLLEDPEINGIVVNFRDTTAKHIAQNKIRESARVLNQAQKIAKLGSLEYLFKSNKVICSKNFLKILELDKDEVITPDILATFMHPNDRDELIRSVERSIEKGEIFNIEGRAILRSGKKKYIKCKGTVNFFEDGTPKRLFITVQDITQRKLIELRLKKSEEKYRHLFEFSPLPMWIYDTETLEFIEVNNAAINIYGYSEEEFLSMTIKDIRPEEETKELFEIIGKVREKKEFSSGVYTHQKKNKEKIKVDVRGNQIDKKNKRRIVVARDITERIKHIETIEDQNNQLHEIAWMQSHTVRAPLARLMGLIECIKFDKEENKDKYLEYIKESAEELDGIIKNIIKSSSAVLKKSKN